MIKITNPENRSFNAIAELAAASAIDYEHADVKLLRFAAGYDVPLHSHTKEALHVILKGKLQLDTGEIVNTFGDYKCGGFEYRARAIEDSLILVIQPKA